MKISPELIPHEQFHTGIWLQSEERPSWYYFTKRKSTNKISNKKFDKSLDKPLKEIVLFLHKQGIKTTPSCAGHTKTRAEFKKIYQELKKDEQLIKTKGLHLKNVETAKVYFCYDQNYELPWSKDEFLKKIMTYQKHGVLGIRLGNRKRIKNELLNLSIKGVDIIERNHVVLLLTRSGNERKKNKTWKEITNSIKRIFKEI